MIKLFSTFLLALTCTVGFTQNWTGNVNADWNNPSNWSSWPLGNQDLTIDPLFYTGAAASPIISSVSVFSPGMILISNNADLVINANLTTQDDVEVIGAGSSLTVNSGTFNVNTTNGGRLIIDLGAAMILNNGTVNIGERFISGEDALITINGGTASTGQRLLMDLGGEFIQNGGTVNVAQTFAMADGNANGSCKYTLNNGSLFITGEMAFENEAGIFEPTFFMTGGTLNVNGNIFWLGVAPGGGRPRFISTGGTITANGLIQNMPLSTVDLYMKIGGTTTFNYNGSLMEMIHLSDSIIQHGSASFVYSGTQSIVNTGTYLAYEGVTTTFNGTSTFNGGGNYDLATVLINPNKSLTLNQHLSLKNNFINNGSFNPQTFRTSFSGTTEQFISGSTLSTFYDLRTNNTSSSGITLQQLTRVNHQLILDLGRINTSNTAILEVLDNATSLGGNAFCFVNGPLRKIGNDAFLFPIGKNNSFGGLAISAPQTLTSQYTAEYFDQASVNTTSIFTPLTAVSPSEYWNLSKSNPSDQVQVTLHWDNASQSGITDCASLTLAHWNTSAWNSIPSSSSGSCVGTNNGSVQSTTTLNETGNFTFGFTGIVTTLQYDVCFGDSVNINGTYYSSNTTFSYVYQDVNNNDSTVITHVSILPQFVSSQTVQLCYGEELNLGGIIYSTNGTYFDTLVGLNGCDSIVSIQLTILPLIESSQTITLCFGEEYVIGNSIYSTAGIYTDTLVSVHGCDSIVTSQISVLLQIFGAQTVQLCFGDQLVLGNSVYTSPGIYLDTITAVNGCDSIITTDLSFDPPFDTTVDVHLLLDFALEMTANATVDAYQWINCSNNTPIANETNQSYMPFTNGVYACILYRGNCSDTTECMIIDDLGITESSLEHYFISPNPSIDGFRILGNTDVEVCSVQIHSAAGQLCFNLESYQMGSYMNPELEKGVYFIQLLNDNFKGSYKLIVE